MRDLDSEAFNELTAANISIKGINEMMKKNVSEKRAVAYRIMRRKALQARMRVQGFEISEAISLPVVRRASFARCLDHQHCYRPVAKTEPDCLAKEKMFVKPRPVPTRRRKYSTSIQTKPPL
jgi:hypothetical protein